MAFTLAQQTPLGSLPIELGKFLPYRYPLLTAAAVVGPGTSVGTIFHFLSAYDANEPHQHNMWAQLHGRITAGVGTVALYVLTSSDGIRWQKAAEGPFVMDNAVRPRMTELMPMICCFPYVAAIAVRTGAAGNPTYSAQIDLLSSAPLATIANDAGVSVDAADVTPAPTPSTSGTEIRGRADIVGALTLLAVVFPTAFPSANYNLQLTLEDVNGVGGTTIWATLRGAAGFTINVGAAPGGANIFRCHWRAILD